MSQVAELLDLREDAVKKRLSRARERIREDLLERFGETVRRAAPAATIAAVVAASLTTAGPTAAAATTIGAAKVVGGSVGGSILAALSGALLGAALGSAGVLFGLKKKLAVAETEEERRQLRKFGVVGVVACTLAASGFAVAGILESAVVVIATQVFFVAALASMYLGWMPRIVAPRLAAEAARDPEAAARHRRERFVCLFGFSSGLLISTATVVFAVLRVLR